MPKTESDPRCNLCNAPILWCSNGAGNWIALDREPRPDGFVFVRDGEAHHVRGDPWEPMWDGPRYVPHQKTCTKQQTKEKT